MATSPIILGEPQNAGQEDQSDETLPAGAVVSPLDPDFLLMVPYALFVDILDFIPGVGTLTSFILGAPVILWMVWRGKRLGEAKDIIQQKRGLAGGRGGKMPTNISSQIQRKILRRGIGRYILNAIPIVGAWFWMTQSVIGMLREK